MILVALNVHADLFAPLRELWRTIDPMPAGLPARIIAALPADSWARRSTTD